MMRKLLLLAITSVLIFGAKTTFAQNDKKELNCFERYEAAFKERGSRSEERRVGKECRSRWSPHHSNKKRSTPSTTSPRSPATSWRRPDSAEWRTPPYQPS